MRIASLGIILFFFVACNGSVDAPEKDIVWTKDQSADFNKNLALEEDLAIRVFLTNKPTWKTIKTGSGLRYFIYKKGKGKEAESGLEAEVSYKINLLDGTLCYQTVEGETQKFEIDHSEVESGVQEGIKKMRVGDKARLIVPSHLAHGLIGDSDKIPPLTTIIIDIELISLK